MALRTKLTELLSIRHPVLQAPMGGTAGGRLASAVSAAGGLGLIGGGRSDAGWLEREFAAAGNERIGCGFITWGLANHPELLDRALDHSPAAVMLSFGDAAPFIPGSDRRVPWLSAKCKAYRRLAACSTKALTSSSRRVARQVGTARFEPPYRWSRRWRMRLRLRGARFRLWRLAVSPMGAASPPC